MEVKALFTELNPNFSSSSRASEAAGPQKDKRKADGRRNRAEGLEEEEEAAHWLCLSSVWWAPLQHKDESIPREE